MRLSIAESPRKLLGLILAGTLTSPSSFGQAAKKSYKIHVPANKERVDTNIDLRRGAKLRFTATGQVTYPRGNQSS
jgi:hypothetical protein